MAVFEGYYNDFYKELSKVDMQNNSFSKIEDMLPKLYGNEEFLDIGCGYGSVSYELIKKGFIVSGVEINNEALKVLLDRGFKIYKKDISEPLNINERFNVVLLLDVLEHVFDPMRLLEESVKLIMRDNNDIGVGGGYVIVSVPLYFDFLDRLKILFTGSIISLDNLCYGIDNYKKFRSYNYDHIRFFRPKDVLEMGEKLGLIVDKVSYGATGYIGNKILKCIVRLISNKYTVNLAPNLLAHSMRIRWKVK